MSMTNARTAPVKTKPSKVVTGIDTTDEDVSTSGIQVIRQTVKPWPETGIVNSYHRHPATGWDTALKTYDRSLTKRSFMEFAPEIRNIIYCALLVMPGPIHVQDERPAYTDITRPEGGWESLRRSAHLSQIIYQIDVMGLLFTSKTIYCETLPLYYSQNTFRLFSSHGLKKLADKLGPQPCEHITKLSILWAGPALAKDARVLGTFSGLQELELDITAFYTFKKSTDQNLQVKVYGLKDLLRIRGLRKLEVRCCSLVHHMDCTTPCTKEQENAFI